jgi:hypothetical protein
MMLVLRPLLHHKKSTVIVYCMYMLLWGSSPTHPHLPILHSAKQFSKPINYLIEELEEVAQG